MKKRRFGKLKTIATLMIISLLSLILFVGKWVISQYKEEQGMLRERLSMIYKDEFENAMDQLIATQMKNPAIKNRVKIDIRSDDSLKLKGTYRISTKTVYATSSLKTLNETKTPDTLADDPADKLITKGLRSFVIQIQDKDSTLPIFIFPDSSQVRNGFSNAIKRQNLDIGISWTPQPAAMSVKMQPHEGGYLVYVTRYQAFVLKKIAPQIGFSLFLVLLCGFAFLLSYRTIRQQIVLNEQKNSFISNISHELKTPLATAKVAIEALQKFEGIHDPAKTTEYLEMAAWEIGRLEKLVASVMNNMQMESGIMQMLRQPTDIDHLLQNLTTNMQPLFTEKQKTLNYHSDVKGLLLDLDAIHIQGVLYNILDNAIKYGGNDVTMKLKQQDAHVFISVSDNGPGIPELYKQKIFEKFFRIPSGNIHDVKGYGLGLNYALYVVKAHGGTIVQENNKEGGAHFIISLPYSHEN
ncbi:MAG TPA: HAMP domain-containing sensor histidine kinase [Flavipsychrobacter sp.]|nr:HAMP domain-containing sensor histidine kinase [Flavipsychrobacter sp.]